MTSPLPQINHAMANMAVNETSEDEMKSRFTSINGYLYTPPEHNANSFSQEEQTGKQKEWQTTLAPIQPRTPPDSPEGKSLPSIASATGYTADDTPMFPERPTDRARSQTPLFDTDRSPSVPRAQTAPGRGDVAPAPISPRLATAGTRLREGWLGISTSRHALQYFNSRMGELSNMRGGLSKLPSPTMSRSFARDDLSRAQLQRISKPTGITKSRSQPRPTINPKAAIATSPLERPLPPKRRTPKVRTTSDFLNDAWPAAQQTKHKRAPPSKKVEGDTANWSELPDYAPDPSTLDSNPKVLKVSWHGSPVDHSADVDRHNLHPQELSIASILRLSCAQYLSNKRKIFQARLQCIKDGKNFTKTAAQGACSIDVNKASQLWEAFEKVGWFKESLFQKFL